MEQWIPLMVAAVAAIAAIGVAFWNSRGESAELRQLKAMNEALAGMTESAQHAHLAGARDELAERVARWVSRAPSRRRLGMQIATSVLGLLLAVLLFVLLGPWLVSMGWDETALNVTATVLGGLTAAGTIGLQRALDPAPRYVRIRDLLKDKSSGARVGGVAE